MEFKSVDVKDRKRQVLTNFLGLDTAHPVYNVDAKRATAMKNLININGSNHKRNGWKQLYRFKDANGHSLEINGYFKFTISQQEFQLVYAGTTFYIWDESQDKFVNLLNVMETNNQSCPNVVIPERLISRKIQMFIYDDKAYIVGCGDMLVFAMYNGLPEIRRVYDDENTTVPRTTTNIAPNEVEDDGNGNTIAYATRQTDRDVNVLTRYRINELIGSAQISNSTPRTYTLDAENIDSRGLSGECYDYDSDNDTQTSYLLSLGTGTSGTRKIAIGDQLASVALTISLDSVIKINKTIAEKTKLLSCGKYFYIDLVPVNSKANKVNLIAHSYSAGEWTESTIGYLQRTSNLNSYTLSSASLSYTSAASSAVVDSINDYDGAIKIQATLESRTKEIIGTKTTDQSTVSLGEINLNTGVITFNNIPLRSIAGEPNISVKFGVYREKATEEVLNARFGTTFGVSGNANVLVLAADGESANVDRWSNEEDFTYFESGNRCEVGTINNKIMAYLRLGDDSLAIIKSKSQTEPTLYIRTGVATSVGENNVVSEGYFKTVGKFISEGAAANVATMLAGDPIFLSEQGVFGISISSDSIAVEQRIARERSKYINALLKQHTNLSNAKAVVFDNRFYLAIEGNVYVADARYKSSERGDMADTFNYEWWMWDNCPIRDMFVIDNELYFGTEDGRICVFDSEYTDRQFEEISSFTPDVVHNYLYPDMTSQEFVKEDLLYIKGDIYRLVLDSSDITVQDGLLYVSEANMEKISEGMWLYADTVTGTGLSVNKKYYVVDVDRAYNCFALEEADGTSPNISASGFRLLSNMNNEVMKVSKVDIDSNNTKYIQVKNYYTDEEYVLAVYNETAISGCMMFKYFKQNVKSEWYTPVMDMGTNDYIKQLLSLTIATEQITDGKITFGWETKSADSLVDLDAKGLDVFDFGNLNFDKFAFDTGFSTSFTRKVKAGFNFIIFRFVSDNEYDSCVHSFTIGYKINRKNKGVF